MEIDGDLEVIWVAIAEGLFLNSLSFGIQPYGNSVGNTMSEVGQHIRKMPGNQLCHLNHSWQAAMHRPEIPAFPKLRCLSRRLVIPQTAQRLVERLRSSGLEFSVLQFRKVCSRLVGHVGRIGQPQ